MALSLTIPGEAVQLSGNPIWCIVAGGSAPVGATGYKLLLKITSTDGDLVGGPFIDAIAPNLTGAAQFDISGYVDQPITPVFQWPAVAVTVAHASASFDIKIEFGETYIDSDGDLQESYDATHQDIRVLKGGISNAVLGTYNDAATTFYDEWIVGGKFLTNQPNNAKVAPGQIVKLWYLGQWTTNHNVTLNTKVITNLSDQYAAITQAVTIYDITGLLELNINPVFQGFTLQAGEYVTSFEFWITDTGGIISERRTYYVDNNYHENSNYLFVANSKSGVDVLWLTGAVEKSIDVTGTEGIKPFAYNATAQTPTILSTSRSGRRKWKINTGFKSAAEMDAMVDVLLSRNLWLYIDSKLTPVLLVNGDKVLSDTMSDLHYTDLELLEAHNTRFA